MTDRIEMLEKMVAEGTTDPFVRYALALEYKKLGQPDDALSAFETLRAEHEGYLPMYLMAGQLLIELERYTEARPWLERGLSVAKAQGNSKAENELRAALVECDDD